METGVIPGSDDPCVFRRIYGPYGAETVQCPQHAVSSGFEQRAERSAKKGAGNVRHNFQMSFMVMKRSPLLEASKS